MLVQNKINIMQASKFSFSRCVSAFNGLVSEVHCNWTQCNFNILDVIWGTSDGKTISNCSPSRHSGILKMNLRTIYYVVNW